MGSLNDLLRSFHQAQPLHKPGLDVTTRLSQVIDPTLSRESGVPWLALVLSDHESW